MPIRFLSARPRLQVPSLFLLAILAGIAFLAACQSVSVQEEPPVVTSTRHFEGSVLFRDSTILPDSVTWDLRGLHGLCVASTDGLMVKVTAEFSEDLGRDSARLNFWKLGIRTNFGKVAPGATGELGFVSGFLGSDSLAKALFRRLANLRGQPNGAMDFPRDRSGLEAAYAQGMVVHDTILVNGFRRAPEMGLDTSRILRLSLASLIKGEGSLQTIAAQWSLPLTADQARQLVLELLRVGGHFIADSTRLFPPPALRVVKPIVLPPLVAGGDAQPLAGSFVADFGIQSVAIRLVQGGDTLGSRFELVGDQNPTGTSWDIGAGIQVRAKAETPAGKYQILVRVRDTKGNMEISVDTFEVLAKPDLSSPRIERVSPLADTTVPNATSVVPVRFRATDDVGVDSAWIEGQTVENLGNGNYFALVALPPSGQPTLLRMQARDRSGNKAVEVLLVTRTAPPNPGPLQVRLSAPAARPARLAADADSFEVVWMVRSDLGLVPGNVTIEGRAARLTQDSLWSLRLASPEPGKSSLIHLSVKDAGGRTGQDTVTVSRSQSIPKIALAVEVDTTFGRVVSRGNRWLVIGDSVRVRWSIQGECSTCQATLDGKSVAISKDRHDANVATAVGDQDHEVVVKYADSVLATGKVRVHRYPALSLVRTAPRADTVDELVSSVEVKWEVKGAQSVKIDGADSTSSKTLYSKQVAIKAATASTTLEAADSLGGIQRSQVDLFRVQKVVLTVQVDRPSDVHWDSALVTIGSTTSGAILEWSTDSVQWKAIPSDGRVYLDRTGRIFARGRATGWAGASASTERIVVRHTNAAPTFARRITDTIRLAEDAPAWNGIWAERIDAGSRWDSAQKLQFRIQPLGAAANLFATLPRIDSVSGALSFRVATDRSGVAAFRVVALDDGGTENFGIDSSRADTLRIRILPVNDAPEVSGLDSARLPLGKGGMVRFNPPTFGAGGGVDEASQQVTFDFQPVNDLASKCFDGKLLVQKDAGTRLFWELDVPMSPNCPSAGTAVFRVVVKDNGGTANGGVDSTVVPYRITLTDTVYDSKGDKYHYGPFAGTFWMKENIGSTCKGCRSAGSTFEFGEAQALCPKGWRLPKVEEWDALVKWAAKGGGADQGAAHLRSTTGWTYDQTGSATQDFSGDDLFGFGIVPVQSMDLRYTWISTAAYWTEGGEGVYFERTYNSGSLPSDMSGMWVNASVRCVIE